MNVMYILSDIEKLIIIAERDYVTTLEKINYVNEKLKKSNLKTIQKSQYYKIRGELSNKTNQRASSIASNLLYNLVNEHDTLIEDRKHYREMLDSAIKDSKWNAALNIKKEQIDLGQRISSISESIHYIMKETLESDNFENLKLDYLFKSESFH